MNEKPTIRGHRINSSQSFPERPYVYGGDQPLVTDKSAAADARQLCADATCTRDEIKARGLCAWHYEKARVARKRAAS